MRSEDIYFLQLTLDYWPFMGMMRLVHSLGVILDNLEYPLNTSIVSARIYMNSCKCSSTIYWETLTKGKFDESWPNC